MSSLTPATRPAATVAEKFLQGSLYLLLVMGFSALAGTARLDPPSLVIGACALLVRGYQLWKGKSVLIPESWTSLLTLLYFAFYALDYFVLSQSFVSATVHLVLFIVVIKIFSVQRDRDLLYLAVLSFLMVLAAAVLTVDWAFLFTFFLFMLTAIATFVSMEMRRSEREARILAVTPANPGRFNRSLYAVSALLGVTTVAVGVVIFFLLPRMSMGGYLQSLGSQTDFVSGFSDTVNLGGIGRIQQSNSPIMHVHVENGILPPDIKWRGTALASFDGRRWSKPVNDVATILPMRDLSIAIGSLRLDNTPVFSNARRPMLAYRVVMEPVGSYVFFLASTPLELSGPFAEVSVSTGGSVTKLGGRSIDVYEGVADTTDPAPLLKDSNSRDYPVGIRMNYLQRPPGLDPRISSLARSITSSAASNYDRAKAVESYLHKNLGYTLDLPGNEADPLAHFLFERKKGHCEYFASAMAIMLRTLDIPTRVVNGFRGGEYNDLNQTYVIRGRDAHSWDEVYFPRYGWVVFDPTPADPAHVGSDVSSRFALYMDALRETWREWIVNYDFSRQVRLGAEISADANHLQGRMHFWYLRKYGQTLRRLRRFLGKIAFGNTFVVCALGLIVMALPFLPRFWRALKKVQALRNTRGAPRAAASLWYMRMLQVLERKGIHKTPTQTPAEFASSIDDLDTQRSVVVFTEHYERARFAGSPDDANRLPELFEALNTKK